MATGRIPLFKGTVAAAATQYVGVPVLEGAVGVQISWKDAVSSATITLELTSYEPDDAPVAVAGAAWVWAGSGVAITGPSGAAASSVLVNLENVRQLRARLKIVAAANSDLEISNGVATA